MTADKFHDALTLLPADLITAVDKLRTQPRKAVIHWGRWLSIAACLAVVLYCGLLFRSGFFSASSMDAAAEMEYAMETEAAPAAQEAAGSIAEDSEIGSGGDCSPAETMSPGSPEPDYALTSEGVVWLNAATQYSLTPLAPDSAENYSAEPRVILIRSRGELDAYYEENRERYDLESFHESCRICYDDAWFAENDLLMVITPALTDGIGGFTGLEVTDLRQTGDGAWEICLSDPPLSDVSTETVTAHILLDIRKDALSPEDTFRVIFE